MPDDWVRATSSDQNNFTVAGFADMLQVQPGETVLRCFWNITCTVTRTNPGQYPPGGSILRVGLAYKEDGGTVPLPISTGTGGDWMDIETLSPEVVLASATDNIWHLSYRLAKDEDVRSQRRNDTASTIFVLQPAWEIAVSNEAPGFGVDFWHTSVDALIRS